MQSENTISLPLSLVNQVMTYLSNKPWIEVHQLIGAIQAQAEAQWKQQHAAETQQTPPAE